MNELLEFIERYKNIGEQAILFHEMNQFSEYEEYIVDVLSDINKDLENFILDNDLS